MPREVPAESDRSPQTDGRMSLSMLASRWEKDAVLDTEDLANERQPQRLDGLQRVFPSRRM